MPDAAIINGTQIASDIREQVKQDVLSLLPQVPGLATVLIGDRTDSATYVRMKQAACTACGINSVNRTLPENASQSQVQSVVRDLNADPAVHAILVQLPLPPHLDAPAILAEISIEKDVDGFHPLNVGNLALRHRNPLFVPCTPRGCIEILKRSAVCMSGAEAVVIGRSDIVGMPMALLLLAQNATVTIAHSGTENLKQVVSRGDIIIAALGKPEFIRGDWLKPGCVVVDVGVNSVEDSSKKRGYRLVGDVHFESCKKVASLITPVPGGVGPMTIAMLLRNCTDAAMRLRQA